MGAALWKFKTPQGNVATFMRSLLFPTCTLPPSPLCQPWCSAQLPGEVFKLAKSAMLAKDFPVASALYAAWASKLLQYGVRQARDTAQLSRNIQA